MWNKITNKIEIHNFMTKMNYFHDSCIKEMKYFSGAYVNNKLSMYPINSKNELSMIVQSQNEKLSMVELVFSDLKSLKMFPVEPDYTCEILDATLLIKDGCIWWCDEGGIEEQDIEDYCGISVCASELRWRIIEGCMGKEEFYIAAK